MSDWCEIDKQIINLKFEATLCFFEDNFVLSSKMKQIDHLPDTNQYIASLEKKLEKIKGSSSKKNKSKDLIESLASVRQDTIVNLLNDNNSTTEDDLNDETLSSGSFLEKKIHPERQALTAEEQQYLLKADYLSKRTEMKNT